jgi:hypothetical protein
MRRKCTSTGFKRMERENCAKESSNNGPKHKAAQSRRQSQITVPPMVCKNDGPHVAANCDNSSRPRRNVGHVLGLRSRGICIEAQRIADGKERSLCYASRNCFWKTSARVTFPRLRTVRLYDKHIKRQEPAPFPSDFMPILAGSQRTQVQSGSSTLKQSRHLSPRGILTSAPSSTGATRTPTL